MTWVIDSLRAARDKAGDVTRYRITSIAETFVAQSGTQALFKAAVLELKRQMRQLGSSQ